jgi:hypothetical protein
MPIPRPLIQLVETANVGHKPSINLKVGFSCVMPLKNSLIIFFNVPFTQGVTPGRVLHRVTMSPVTKGPAASPLGERVMMDDGRKNEKRNKKVHYLTYNRPSFTGVMVTL